MYASEVWSKDVKDSTSVSNKLSAHQRKVINALIGAYKTTNSEKLLELLGLCSLTEEISIVSKINDQDKSIRETIRESLRNELWNKKDSFGFQLNIGLIKHRYAVWFISGVGPFRDYLFKTKKPDNPWCRYCYFYPETSVHLLYECELIDREGWNLDDVKDFECRCINLVGKLFKDQNR